MTSSYMFLQVSLSGHNGLVPQTVRKRAIPPYWCFWRVFSQAWGKISVRIQWDTTQHERGRKLSHIFNLRDRSETSQARRPLRLYAHGGQIPNTEVKLWLPEAGTGCLSLFTMSPLKAESAWKGWWCWYTQQWEYISRCWAGHQK